MYRILNTTPTPLETVMPGLDPEISRIIERAMLKEPERRHQNADDLREDFATLRQRLTGASAVPSSDIQASADVRSGRHALAGIARDSSPLLQEAPASSAKTIAAGSAGAAPTPTRPAPPRRGRLKLAAIAAAAVTAILATVFYRNATLDRPHPLASTDPKPQSALGSAPAAPGPTSATGALDPDRRAIDERLNEIRATARRQLAAADHPQLLNTLSAGLVLDAGDVDLNGLIDELKREARQLTVQARTNASRRGATEDSSLEFRDGRAREREGEALERSGDRAQAIRTLWAAAELYGRAARMTAQRGTPPAPLPPAPQPQPPVAKIEAPPLPDRQSSPGPPPAPESDPPPQPAPPQRAEPSTPAPVDGIGDARANDTAAIADTLRRYASAYRSLDIAAVRKVLPSLNAQQLRSLETDFSNYRSYTVEVADPRIAIDHDTATARCQVTRSFVTKNGVAGGHAVATTFHLRKVDAAWVIERLESR